MNFGIYHICKQIAILSLLHKTYVLHEVKGVLQLWEAKNSWRQEVFAITNTALDAFVFILHSSYCAFSERCPSSTYHLIPSTRGFHCLFPTYLFAFALLLESLIRYGSFLLWLFSPSPLKPAICLIYLPITSTMLPAIEKNQYIKNTKPNKKH